METLTTKSEPKGKLDTMATQPATMLAADGVVNGPEDELLDWHAVGWRAAEEDVRRLRQRIFTASRVGDLKRVRSLQKLMLRSRANTLLSVRRVTELNAGRATAGVDGKVVLLAESKALLVDRVQRQYLRGVFQADSRRQPTSAVANRTRKRLLSRRLLTGQTALLVTNQVPA